MSSVGAGGSGASRPITTGGTPGTLGSPAALFWLGVLLWLGVMVINWPLALSFGDEVGYVGQTKLILQGRITPTMTDLGVWHPDDHGGWVPKYPLMLALVLAPLYALSPTLLFLPGILAGIGLAWVAGRILESWGHSRLWGLLVLMDPTVVLLSRTVMADVGLAALALGTWYAFQRRNFWGVVVLAAATMGIKTNGVVTIGMLLLGEGYVCWRDRRGQPLTAALRPVVPLLWGLGLGAVVIVALNLLANGTIHSSYRESAGEAFKLSFLRTTGLAHAKALVLCPPLLFLGVWPFWQRRNFAAIGAIVATTVMMSVFFFVDWGVGPIDTLVMSRRLMLPVIAFLLVGYAERLATLARRLSLHKVAPLALIILPAAVSLAISAKHLQWQRPRAHALARAQAWTASKQLHELGVNPWAQKIGLLYPGRTVFVRFGTTSDVEFILCATSEASYRNGTLTHSCEIPGYRTVEALPDDGYEILEHLPRAGDAALPGPVAAPPPSPTPR